MDFVKDLLKIQHNLILDQVSTKLLNDDFEKEQFKDKYDKRNYCLVKVCNCKLIDNRVKIKDLLSTLTV
jgi:hypothetical protein|tara:strand:+ start:535 stop:741 length:207 start_codon:yes stop_codon:yes gene_type:complete